MPVKTRADSARIVSMQAGTTGIKGMDPRLPWIKSEDGGGDDELVGVSQVDWPWPV